MQRYTIEDNKAVEEETGEYVRFDDVVRVFKQLMQEDLTRDGRLVIIEALAKAENIND